MSQSGRVRPFQLSERRQTGLTLPSKNSFSASSLSLPSQQPRSLEHVVAIRLCRWTMPPQSTLDQSPALDNNPAVDDRKPSTRGCARHQRCDRVELRTGVLEVVDPKRDEIRGSSLVPGCRCHRAQGRPRRRASPARARRVRRSAPADGSPPSLCNPLQQHRLSRFAQHLIAVVAGRAVHAERDLHAAVQHLAHRRDAGAENHVAAGAMAHAGAGARHAIDLRRFEVDHVREPGVGSQPIDRLRIVERALPKLLLAESGFVDGLG